MRTLERNYSELINENIEKVYQDGIATLSQIDAKDLAKM